MGIVNDQNRVVDSPLVDGRALLFDPDLAAPQLPFFLSYMNYND